MRLPGSEFPVDRRFVDAPHSFQPARASVGTGLRCAARAPAYKQNLSIPGMLRGNRCYITREGTPARRRGYRFLPAQADLRARAQAASPIAHRRPVRFPGSC